MTRFDFSVDHTLRSQKTYTQVHASPTPVYKSNSMRHAGKENMDFGHMNQRFMSNNNSGFNPQVFQHDSFNPLYYQSHAHSLDYEQRQSFVEHNYRVSESRYSGDFKPLTGNDHHNGMGSSHNYSTRSARGREANEDTEASLYAKLGFSTVTRLGGGSHR